MKRQIASLGSETGNDNRGYPLTPCKREDVSWWGSPCRWYPYKSTSFRTDYKSKNIPSVLWKEWIRNGSMVSVLSWYLLPFLQPRGGTLSSFGVTQEETDPRKGSVTDTGRARGRSKVGTWEAYLWSPCLCAPLFLGLSSYGYKGKYRESWSSGWGERWLCTLSERSVADAGRWTDMEVLGPQPTFQTRKDRNEFSVTACQQVQPRIQVIPYPHLCN